MGNKTIRLKTRVTKLESLMETLDGQKTRKPRKKKIFKLEDIPCTKGFGGKKILKDGHYGNFSVYFNEVYVNVPETTDQKVTYLRSLKANMMKNFGRFAYGDDPFPIVEVDNSHLRKRRAK